MTTLHLGFVPLLLLCVGVSGLSVLAGPNEEVGATQVARWKDGKKAAFVLMFDDSIPSHVKNVIPELQKRGMIGTFYVNPARPSWSQSKQAWEKQFPAMGMEYGNHTYTHSGFDNLEGADAEFAKCSEIILACYPDQPTPRLLSYGQPGGIKPERWQITPEQTAELLKKYHLIDRPPFGGHGAAINVKTADEMTGLVDDALAKGNMGYIVFHGVGGDWISADLPVFIDFLDRLAAKRDQVWVTAHIPAHKYETEQASAATQIQQATAAEIRLTLSCKADPKLYDLPLTLITRVPQTWTACQITQGGKTTTATAAQDTLQYEALPNGEPITIRPAAKQ